MTVKVSVLMPVYKTQEEHLRASIQSILNQTFTDFELLIVDDCPSDTREDIVKSYSDRRIKYFKNDQNMGISRARNKLIDLSSGEYLAVFDHDDISLPTRLEKEVEYLDSHPNVGVVSSWWKSFPRSNIISKNPEKDHDIKVMLSEYCIVSHTASMIRKSVLIDNNIRYEEEYSPSEDYMLWCRLIDYTEFYNIPEVLSLYRIHPGSTTNHQLKKMELMTWKIRVMMRSSHPELYREYQFLAQHIYRISLFGLIPIFKIELVGYTKKIFLFDKILLMKIRYGSRLPR